MSIDLNDSVVEFDEFSATDEADSLDVEFSEAVEGDCMDEFDSEGIEFDAIDEPASAEADSDAIEFSEADETEFADDAEYSSSVAGTAAALVPEDTLDHSVDFQPVDEWTDDAVSDEIDDEVWDETEEAFADEGLADESDGGDFESDPVADLTMIGDAPDVLDSEEDV
ncbi:MAG: hypothetical protein O3A00_21760, partial [Planctomycetota bacterium]|nr:hypothetical protein [Planctomycetota bacterium]